MFFVDKETGKKENRNACGAHVNRLLNVLTPRAEYSREMFRVIPWEAAIAAAAFTAESTPPDAAVPQHEHSGRHSPAAVHLLYGTPRPQMGALGFNFTIDVDMGLSNVPRSNGEHPTCASASS